MSYFTYNNIISIENLLQAWEEFLCGKRSRKDVQKFEENLMEHIIALYSDLSIQKYKHSEYHPFNISNPSRTSAWQLNFSTSCEHLYE